MILGQGSYGKVIARHGVAVKQFSRVSHLVQEYGALRYLMDCPHIVKPLGLHIGKLELYMDLYDMSLRRWMENNNGKLFAAEGQNLIRHVIYGLIELHERGLAHGDLKPGNILVRRENNQMIAVLGDCGFVSVAKYAKVERTAAIYRDPVISHDVEHDMYSLGICLLEMIGEIYISRQANYTQLKAVIKQKITNPHYAKLISRLVHADRSKRPSASEVLHYLYGEEYSSRHRTEIPSMQIVESYMDDEPRKKLRKYMKNKSYEYGINRSQLGYIALLQHLHQENIDVKHYQIYADLTLYILASVFGNSQYCRKNLTDLANKKYNENMINTILKSFLQNSAFLQTLLLN